MSLQHGVQDTKSTSACLIPGFEETQKGSTDPLIRKEEKIVYEKAMKMFCDMKSQKAFQGDYKWPEIPSTL